MIKHIMRALGVLLCCASSVTAQHEGHQTGVTPALDATACAKSQPAVAALLDAATARLEAARQSNDPTAMRAVVDDMQAAIRDTRVQLAPCAALMAAAADPHAGHAMPQPSPSAAAAQPTASEEIAAWLNGYDAAFMAKDLDKLATFYHPDVTIFEGAGVNRGWIDYRDRHLGPELEAFGNLQFGHTNRRVHMLGDRAAYVISDYFIKATMTQRVLDNIGLETLVIEKQDDGTWKIRHSHTSGRARPAK